MDWALNEDQQAVLEMVRDFAQREVRPRAHDIDETGEYPADLVAKMADLGLMGIPFPPEYGGAGMSYVTFALSRRRTVPGVRVDRPDHGRQYFSIW